MTDKLRILTAGVTKAMVEKAAATWNVEYPELICDIVADGSVELTRKVKNGEPCDVLISSDDFIIKSMLIPQFAEKFTVFAANRMVIMALQNKTINSDNWRECLLSPGSTFGYSDPLLDPSGYRAEMLLQLADNVEKGLSEKLLKHPGRKVLAKPDDMSVDYKIYYYSKTQQTGKPFAELPPEMNLGDKNMNKLYAKVEFNLGDIQVKGSAIRHALTIPKAAQHKEKAQEFVKLFLAQDFKKEGFMSI